VLSDCLAGFDVTRNGQIRLVFPLAACRERAERYILSEAALSDQFSSII